MRLLGWITQQQTAPLGDGMAPTIHVHPMLIICEFGKHFVNVPTFIPHRRPPSISSTDWQDDNNTFSPVWLRVGDFRHQRTGRLTFPFLFVLCSEVQPTGRSQRSRLQRLHRVLKLPGSSVKLTRVKMTITHTHHETVTQTHTYKCRYVRSSNSQLLFILYSPDCELQL